MNKFFLSFVYVLLIVLANWSVGVFGPVITPLNALLFIGVDFAIRDKLNMQMSWREIALLITVASVVTYVFNTAPTQVALASALAFFVSQSVDSIVFNNVRGTFVKRSFVSNVFGAATDSLLFPTIAFGTLLPGVVAAQFVCKVIGASIVVLYFKKKSAPEESA